MVFPIGKRKITNITTETSSQKSTPRRPLPTSYSSSSSTTTDLNKTSKLKSISNDLNNKNLKLKTTSKQYDESPKSKINKQNDIKQNRDMTNKKSSNKQSNSDLFGSHHHQHNHNHNQHYSYADHYNEDFFNFESEETFQKHEQQYEKHINLLKEQLEKLNQFDLLAKENKLNSTLINQNISELNIDGYNYLNKFLNEIQQVEKESIENLSVVKNWYEKQKQEIELQYTLEQKRAIQEFQDKRRELKETLRNEYEEKRKKIEIDKNTADINMDNSDPKPTTTRKLRRRFNGPISNLTSNTNPNFDFSMDSNSYDIDTESLGIGASSLMSSSAAQLVNTAALGLTASMVVASALCSNVNTNSTNVNSYYANTILNNLSSSNNERKRKFGPAAITFTISEDEINEDLKFLS